ncbi:hypothetical protein INT43_005906 [Umbelopsis isabellina]|uniref:Yeast cell wall synthesis Kre9/Knh1-like N-terminal domain-containing protein n=1 Tax=Mortierella isabellina TaxID=91625 RepID=A0A8H7PJV2_MORIS|nr:hypothetical protein INT43_005906 [Umbelopsis isabellina]
MGVKLDFSSTSLHGAGFVQQRENATLFPNTAKANTAWATASSALSLDSPAPNSTLPIGEMFSVEWKYTQVAAASDQVTVSLLSSPSTTDVVEILFTDIPEQFNSWPAIVNQATPNTEYYLFLNDTTSPGVVAGPYHFASTSTEPYKLPGYIIAIIVIVVVLAIIAVVLVCHEMLALRFLSAKTWLLYMLWKEQHSQRTRYIPGSNSSKRNAPGWYYWLLATWVTAAYAMTITVPAPNSILTLGNQFTITWVTKKTLDDRGTIDIVLLNSTSTADVVSVLATQLPEAMASTMVVVNDAQPNSNYYLYLHDSNPPSVIAGPYYLKSSTPSPPPLSTTPAPASASSSDSDSASAVLSDIPGWLIAVIVVGGLLVGSIVCGCLPWCPPPRRRWAQNSNNLPQRYQPDVNEMTITGYNQAIASPNEKSYAQQSSTQPLGNTTVQNAPSSVPQRTADDHV